MTARVAALMLLGFVVTACASVDNHGLLVEAWHDQGRVCSVTRTFATR